MFTYEKRSVAEHTLFALLLHEMFWPCFCVDQVRVSRGILKHDWPEAFSGDIPYPFKNFASEKFREELYSAEVTSMDRVNEAHPDLGLSSLEFRVVKFFDRLELHLYATQELKKGNPDPEMADVLKITTNSLCEELASRRLPEDSLNPCIFCRNDKPDGNGRSNFETLCGFILAPFIHDEKGRIPMEIKTTLYQEIRLQIFNGSLFDGPA